MARRACARNGNGHSEPVEDEGTLVSVAGGGAFAKARRPDATR